MQKKTELRKFAKDLRQKLDMKEISEKILQIFISTDLYKKAKNIAIYYPYLNEPDLLLFFEFTHEKNFFLPKITQTGSLSFHKYNKTDVLIKNKFGIYEPTSAPTPPEMIDIIIIPALMADKSGYRLGYGKGYYDKFFAENNINATKIIFLPEELLTENLPHDDWDIPANLVITQKNSYPICKI